jgi:hypothetical protein
VPLLATRQLVGDGYTTFEIAVVLKVLGAVDNDAIL